MGDMMGKLPRTNIGGQRLASRSWLETLSMVRGGGRAADLVRVLDRTPDELITLGFPNLPWYTDGAHVARELRLSVDGGHGIPYGTMENMDLFLADPVAVSIGDHRGLSRDHRRVSLALDCVNDVDEPIVAIADLNGVTDDGERCVWLATVSGRSNPVNYFHAAVKQGGFALLDTERLSALLARSGASLSSATLRADTDSNLIRKLAAGEIELKYDEFPCDAPETKKEEAPMPFEHVRKDGAAAEQTVTVKEATGVDSDSTDSDPVTDFDRRVIEPLRESVDDWFFQHRYDVIGGDPNAFIDRIARQLAAGIVLSGKRPDDDDVETAVTEALHAQIQMDGGSR